MRLMIELLGDKSQSEENEQHGHEPFLTVGIRPFVRRADRRWSHGRDLQDVVIDRNDPVLAQQ